MGASMLRAVLAAGAAAVPMLLECVAQLSNDVGGVVPRCSSGQVGHMRMAVYICKSAICGYAVALWIACLRAWLCVALWRVSLWRAMLAWVHV